MGTSTTSSWPVSTRCSSSTPRPSLQHALHTVRTALTTLLPTALKKYRSSCNNTPQGNLRGYFFQYRPRMTPLPSGRGSLPRLLWGTVISQRNTRTTTRAVLPCNKHAISLRIALTHLHAAGSITSLHPVVARHLIDMFIAQLSGV